MTSRSQTCARIKKKWTDIISTSGWWRVKVKPTSKKVEKGTNPVIIDERDITHENYLPGDTLSVLIYIEDKCAH